jgi:hypothetical protein
MATVAEMSSLDQIGEAAGSVWRYLDENGPQSMTKLIKQVDVPRDLLMQGIGWLAREDKISIEDGPRSRIISLK